MMIIGQYTDQDVLIVITGGSLDNISGIHITFEQCGNSIDLTNVTIESSSRLIVSLTQAHTGKFRAGIPVKVQMNYFNAFGKRKKQTSLKSQSAQICCGGSWNMDDVIQISIAEEETPITLSVQDDDTPITLTISETGDTPPIYDGETVVVPSAHAEQQLLTRNKLILSNITVTEIPYAEVSNVGGGYTATIAS